MQKLPLYRNCSANQATSFYIMATFAFNELIAISRIMHCMNFKKKRSAVNAFFSSQFNYGLKS